MKILIFCYHIKDAVGGAEIQCDIIARGMVEHGHEVLYLSPMEAEVRQEVYKNYNLIHVGKNFNSIYDEICNYNPDVIYWRAYKGDFYKLSKLLSKKFKLVYAVSALHDVSYKPYWSIFVNNFTIKSLLKFVKNVYVTFWQRQAFVHFTTLTFLNSNYLSYINHKNKIIIRNSMDINISSSIPWKRKYVIWVANIKPTKRPEEFFRLAKKFEDIDIDFLMIGRYNCEHSEYSYLNDENSWPKNFYYLGEKSLEEVNFYIKNSLFHVHTCDPEGFGNIFIQAWLLQKASLSLNFDPEGLINKYNLGYFSDGDINLFYKQFKSLIDNPDLLNEKSINARKIAYQYFSKDNMIDKITNCFVETSNER